jgi:hypothetical protein
MIIFFYRKNGLLVAKEEEMSGQGARRRSSSLENDSEVSVNLASQFCGSGFGIRFLFDPWIRDGYQNRGDSLPGSGSGMNNPDHISESLEKFFLG